MKLQRLSSSCLLGLSLAAIPATSFAAVNFQLNFVGNGGFNDPIYGEARRNEIQSAADYVASFLTGYDATIVMDVNGGETRDQALASASSNYNYYPEFAGFGGAGDVMRKILGYADPSPEADGEINWNFEDFDWATGETVGPGEFDLKSTAIHELTHAIGFTSDILPDGTNAWGDGVTWSPFDEFVADSTGALIDSNFELDGDRWNAASVGGTGASGLAFIGENAMAANGGNPVYLYSPTTWSDGSSGSHLDTDFYTGENGTIENLMNHASSHGTGELDIRGYTAIEIGIMRDIGYTLFGVSAVPEAGQTALVLGLGFLGFLGLRKRRMAAASQKEQSAA